MLLAGTARVNITPITQHPIHMQLEVKALVLKNEAVAFAIVSCDMCGIRSDLADIIRRNTSASTGIPFDNIAISCSHTHSDGFNSFFAAGTGHTESFPKEGWEPWLDELATRIVSCIERANSTLAQVKLSSALTDANGIAAPARLRLINGEIHCLKVCSPLPWRDELSDTQDECDNALLITRLTGRNGGVLAHIVNFSCHANSSASPGEEPLISGDFPAIAMKLIEQQFGGVALFLNGASADVYPVDYMKQRGISYAKKLGTSLAGSVISLDESLKNSDKTSDFLAVEASHIKLLRRKRDMTSVTQEINEKRQGLVDELVFHKLALNFEQFVPRYLSYLEGDKSQSGRIEEYLQNIRNMEKICSRNVDIKTMTAVGNGTFSYILPEGTDEKYIPLTIQALRLGNTAFVFFPSEIFTGIGLNIKKNSPFPMTGIVSHTNAAIGYIPGDKAFEEGGYQLMYSLVEKGTENLLQKTAQDLLTKLCANI